MVRRACHVSFSYVACASSLSVSLRLTPSLCAVCLLPATSRIERTYGCDHSRWSKLRAPSDDRPSADPTAYTQTDTHQQQASACRPNLLYNRLVIRMRCPSHAAGPSFSPGGRSNARTDDRSVGPLRSRRQQRQNGRVVPGTKPSERLRLSAGGRLHAYCDRRRRCIVQRALYTALY